MGNERHDGEQSHQQRRGSGHGSVRPLSLGLDAEMRTDFLKGNFHLPTLNEPWEDGLRRRLRVGTKKRLRFGGPPGDRAPAPSGSAPAACRCDTTPPYRRRFPPSARPDCTHVAGSGGPRVAGSVTTGSSVGRR